MTPELQTLLDELNALTLTANRRNPADRPRECDDFRLIEAKAQRLASLVQTGMRPTDVIQGEVRLLLPTHPIPASRVGALAFVLRERGFITN
jgi:hypothetical protein